MFTKLPISRLIYYVSHLENLPTNIQVDQIQSTIFTILTAPIIKNGFGFSKDEATNFISSEQKIALDNKIDLPNQSFENYRSIDGLLLLLSPNMDNMLLSELIALSEIIKRIRKLWIERIKVIEDILDKRNIKSFIVKAYEKEVSIEYELVSYYEKIIKLIYVEFKRRIFEPNLAKSLLIWMGETRKLITEIEQYMSFNVHDSYPNYEDSLMELNSIKEAGIV